MLFAATWTYAAVLVAIPVGLRRLGDHWWPTTIFLFGPRYVAGLPLLALFAVAAILRPRLLPVLAALSALFLFGTLGFVVPWGRLVGSSPARAPSMRLLTWNLGGQVRGRDSGLPLRIASLREAQIVVLQECGEEDVALAPEWHTRFDAGQCLLSLFPVVRTASRPRDDVWAMGGSGAIVSYEIEAPGGRFTLTNVHLETPRDGLEAVRYLRLAGVPELEQKNVHRRLEARLAREWAESLPGPRVVAGDFNMTSDSAVFREAWSGLRDAFEEAGFGFGYTKHTRLIGTRIDHVLVDEAFRVDRAEVGEAAGPDHRPLVVELARR